MQLIRVEQAIEEIHSYPLELGTEEIFTNQSLGRVLSENIIGDRDLPPYNRSTMDGIAISNLNNNEASVDGILYAGETNEHIPENFQAIEIMTGAIVPNNTHCIIPKEELIFFEKNGKKWVKWPNFQPKEMQFIHLQGSDSKKGDILVNKGKKINALDIALALSVGNNTLLVEKRPKIAIISTGDELVSVEENPLPHQIRSSNSGMLASILTEKGLSSELFHLKDDKDSLLKNLRNIIEKFDVLLISGGVSAGKKDFLPECLEQLSIKKVFHKIAQKPGKPLWFGLNLEKKKWVFAFPGNPISTFLCSKIYFLPWLLKIEIFKGYCNVENPQFKSVDLDLWLPFQWIKENSLAKIINHNGSGDMVSWSKADGFILKKPNQEERNFPFVKI